jgi:hypothetical protein
MVSWLSVVTSFIHMIPIKELERSHYNALLFSVESLISKIYPLSCIQLHVQTSSQPSPNTNAQHQHSGVLDYFPLSIRPTDLCRSPSKRPHVLEGD